MPLSPLPPRWGSDGAPGCRLRPDPTLAVVSGEPADNSALQIKLEKVTSCFPSPAVEFPTLRRLPHATPSASRLRALTLVPWGFCDLHFDGRPSPRGLVDWVGGLCCPPAWPLPWCSVLHPGRWVLGNRVFRESPLLSQSPRPGLGVGTLLAPQAGHVGRTKSRGLPSGFTPPVQNSGRRPRGTEATWS